ncbi:MAG: sel1 repeat family protein [Candidatus Coatesbacteria bacterium]|nr:sel1 repeat family protein [Candidatus Coatesbacteria bacterium]
MNSRRPHSLFWAVLFLLLAIANVDAGLWPGDARAILHEAIGLYTGTSGSQDHAAAKELFLEAAKAGDPLAQMWAAMFYRTGWCGFHKDKEFAKKTAKSLLPQIRSLAEQGDVEATFLMGAAFYYGVGVRKDKSETLKWLLKAGEAGHPEAMRHLGHIYECEKCGFEINHETSLRWYLKAAEAGHVYAMAVVA